MDEIFIAIMEQIAQEMPELSLIDEDYGQLEMGAEEDQYPVTFPCHTCRMRSLYRRNNRWPAGRSVRIRFSVPRMTR